MNKAIIIILVSFVCACAAPINRHSASNHVQSANAAISMNDWVTAKKHWAKAVLNARLGNLGPKALTSLNYEYGRSLGVTCFYKESEEYLKYAYDYDKANSGPVHMAMLELARLNYDQKKYSEAIPYFEGLMPIYQKHNVENIDPSGVALVYEEYSKSLASTGDKVKSEELASRAEKLKKVGNRSSTERTPYGTQCQK